MQDVRHHVRDTRGDDRIGRAPIPIFGRHCPNGASVALLCKERCPKVKDAKDALARERARRMSRQRPACARLAALSLEAEEQASARRQRRVPVLSPRISRTLGGTCETKHPEIRRTGLSDTAHRARRTGCRTRRGDGAVNANRSTWLCCRGQSISAAFDTDAADLIAVARAARYACQRSERRMYGESGLDPLLGDALEDRVRLHRRGSPIPLGCRFLWGLTATWRLPLWNRGRMRT